jgi:hypothetical protein
MRVGLVVVALAALSMLLVAPAPSYDPWMWLLWGREVADGELSTEEGPAFKPLPVAVCAALAPLGSVAPVAWVLLARSAALAAIWLAFRLGRRLGGSTVAGVLAAIGVALCGAYPSYAASGIAEAMLLAFALAGAEAWRADRPRAALACGVGCALLRVEAWPFLLAAGLVLWRRRPQDRARPPGGPPPASAVRRLRRLRPGGRAGSLLAALAVAVPALWLVPEWIGSGDVLRSGARARMPNPGQPALADVPAAAALGEAIALPLWPLWAGVAMLVVRRRKEDLAALAPAAVGAAWILLVAAMAQAGFSGEPRYSLPGAALVAISGAIGIAVMTDRWARLTTATVARRRAPLALAGALVLLAALPRLADLPDLRRAQAYQWDLAADLADAVRAAGGRSTVLACGRPYVGHLRGPLMAYRLGVEKRVVQFEPRPPGVVFRSRLNARAAPAPAVPPAFAEVSRAGRWQVLNACGVREP